MIDLLPPEADCSDVSTGCWVSNALSYEHLLRNNYVKWLDPKKKKKFLLVQFP
jgi:hypothetical protein